MTYEVQAIPGGRRSTDRIPLSDLPTATTHKSHNLSDLSWVILTSIIVTALLVGGLSMVYHQSEMNSLRADYQLQIERLQNQMRTLQLQESLKPTPSR
ncbi:MAG TPA: hypothetical protein VK338_02375 [Candidatus Nitrosocosmicus sp.]|nr:hypothetical protein [Candidatus Nitrosocosmicus sp.]